MSKTFKQLFLLLSYTKPAPTFGYKRFRCLWPCTASACTGKEYHPKVMKIRTALKILRYLYYIVQTSNFTNVCGYPVRSVQSLVQSRIWIRIGNFTLKQFN